MDSRLEVSNDKSNLGTKKAAAIMIAGTKTILTVLQKFIWTTSLLMLNVRNVPRHPPVSNQNLRDRSRISHKDRQ